MDDNVTAPNGAVRCIINSKPIKTIDESEFTVVTYTKTNNKYPAADGSFPSYNNWWMSDYIPIDETGFYYLVNRPNAQYESSVDNAIYNTNKTIISTIPLLNNKGSYVHVDVPENAKYLVVSNASNATISIKTNQSVIYKDSYKGIALKESLEKIYKIDAEVKKKVDKNQGLLNKTKALITDEEGNVSPLNIGVKALKDNSLYVVGNDSGDIIRDNYNVVKYIKDVKQRIYQKPTVPLALLHFSDIHGHSTELSRVIQFADYLGNNIDDVIHTGDMVISQWRDGYDFWTGVNGSHKILTCIGNHDVNSGPYTSYGSGITMSMAYNRYFAPYIANWGVEYTEGKTYYYKDYTEKKIRLICLDFCTSATSDQNVWLESVLSDVKTKGYTVVIMEHTPVHYESHISCNFNMPYSSWDSEFGNSNSNMNLYQATVQNFIDDGGKFACYLTGHSHYDKVTYNTNYPNQICIAVTCAHASSYYNEQVRESGTRSMDAFNVVLIDTEFKTITLLRVGANIDNYLRPRNVLTISYETKDIITEY